MITGLNTCGNDMFASRLSKNSGPELGVKGLIEALGSVGKSNVQPVFTTAQQMMHPQHPEESDVSSPLSLLGNLRFLFRPSASPVGAYGRIERWTMVPCGVEGFDVGSLSFVSVSSSCSIFPR